MYSLQVLSSINELRRCKRSSDERNEGMSPRVASTNLGLSRSVSSEVGRDKYSMVSLEEVSRIDCLMAYIKDANAGRGMVSSALLSFYTWDAAPS